MQNAPNPFNETTIINYVVPSNASRASIQVFDVNGAVLKQIDLADKGAGQLTIRAFELPAGTYVYNLVVDGEIIDTKKMILTN